jgi:hypothetical protein
MAKAKAKKTTKIQADLSTADFNWIANNFDVIKGRLEQVEDAICPQVAGRLEKLEKQIGLDPKLGQRVRELEDYIDGMVKIINGNADCGEELEELEDRVDILALMVQDLYKRAPAKPQPAPKQEPVAIKYTLLLQAVDRFIGSQGTSGYAVAYANLVRVRGSL